MKRIFAFILVAALALPMFAQEEGKACKDKNCQKDFSAYLPAAGDFALGFNLNPFVNFVGKMFNNSVNGTIDNSAIGGSGLIYNSDVASLAVPYSLVSINGKYMLSDQFGIRANVGLILNRQNQSVYSLDDAALALDPLSRTKVIDTYHNSQTGGSISAGAEYRIGKGRVQGVFSGNALYAFAIQNETYTYGNAITEYNQVPTTHAFSPSTWQAVSSAMPNARLMRDYTGSASHTVGLVASAGFECFVGPKVSLGAEVNLALLYSWTPQRYGTYEGFNIFSGEVETFTDLVEPKSSDFVFGTQNVGANLFMNFYFGSK